MKGVIPMKPVRDIVGSKRTTETGKEGVEPKILRMPSSLAHRISK